MPDAMVVDDQPQTENTNGNVDKANQKFIIKKVTIPTLWQWDIDVSNCAICKNHLGLSCNFCQANAASATADECTIAWGRCNHAYHFHCISKWIQEDRMTCPLCNREWEISKVGH